MNKQEIFDTAVRGLRAQGYERAGWQAVERFICLYRAPDGSKCAIGHCIPDDKYREELEDWGATEVWETIHPKQVLTPVEREFLISLQSCHDGGDSPEEMQAHLRDCAIHYDLSWPD